MPNHVHLFVEPDVLREEFHFLRSRLPTLWSRSYFAATVGSVTETAVSEYIEGQKGK